MDPVTAFGTVASIITLAQTALSLSQKLHLLGSTIASAQEDLQVLAGDLGTFSQSLTVLSQLLEDSRVSKPGYSSDADQLTAEIIKHGAEIYKKVDKILTKLGGNGKGNWKIRVKFDYKEKEIWKMMKRLRDMKETLATILMTLQVDLHLTMLNITNLLLGPSKIQQPHQKSLQLSTTQNLSAFQAARMALMAIESCGFLPAYSSLPQNATHFSGMELDSLPSGYKAERSSQRSLDTATLPSLPKVHTETTTLVNSNDGPVSASEVQCFSMLPTESRQSASSVERFQSAVSEQSTTFFARKTKGVQIILDAFRKTVDALASFVDEEVIDKKSGIYEAVRNLEGSLIHGESVIEHKHLLWCKIYGDPCSRSYLDSYTEYHTAILEEIATQLVKEVAIPLKANSSGHQKLLDAEFHDMYDRSESCRIQALWKMRELLVLARLSSPPIVHPLDSDTEINCNFSITEPRNKDEQTKTKSPPIKGSSRYLISELRETSFSESGKSYHKLSELSLPELQFEQFECMFWDRPPTHLEPPERHMDGRNTQDISSSLVPETWTEISSVNLEPTNEVSSSLCNSSSVHNQGPNHSLSSPSFDCVTRIQHPLKLSDFPDPPLTQVSWCESSAEENNRPATPTNIAGLIQRELVNGDDFESTSKETTETLPPSSAVTDGGRIQLGTVDKATSEVERSRRTMRACRTCRMIMVSCDEEHDELPDCKTCQRFGDTCSTYNKVKRRFSSVEKDSTMKASSRSDIDLCPHGKRKASSLNPSTTVDNQSNNSSGFKGLLKAGRGNLTLKLVDSQGRTGWISVRESERIDKVKNEIRKRTQWPDKHMDLYHNGTLLYNEGTLREYKVQDLAIVHLFMVKGSSNSDSNRSRVRQRSIREKKATSPPSRGELALLACNEDQSSSNPHRPTELDPCHLCTPLVSPFTSFQPGTSSSFTPLESPPSFFDMACTPPTNDLQALEDYQVQLVLFEQISNKKKMVARHEQDSINTTEFLSHQKHSTSNTVSAQGTCTSFSSMNTPLFPPNPSPDASSLTTGENMRRLQEYQKGLLNNLNCRVRKGDSAHLSTEISKEDNMNCRQQKDNSTHISTKISNANLTVGAGSGVDALADFDFQSFLSTDSDESSNSNIKSPTSQATYPIGTPIEEQPLFVNSKQFSRILKRRVARQSFVEQCFRASEQSCNDNSSELKEEDPKLSEQSHHSSGEGGLKEEDLKLSEQSHHSSSEEGLKGEAAAQLDNKEDSEEDKEWVDIESDGGWTWI